MSQATDLLQVVLLALNHCRERGKDEKGWLVAALDREGGGCWVVELDEKPAPVAGAVAVNLNDWSMYLGVRPWVDGLGYRAPFWRPLDVSLRGGVLP